MENGTLQEEFLSNSNFDLRPLIGRETTRARPGREQPRGGFEGQ